MVRVLAALIQEKYAAEMQQKHGGEAVALDDPRDVHRGADILASCTDSAVPVIKGEWLEEGMHVIAIGGRPDAQVWQRRRLGKRAPAVTGLGTDLMFADIVGGKTRGRTSERRITYSERGNIRRGGSTR